MTAASSCWAAGAACWGDVFELQISVWTDTAMRRSMERPYTGMRITCTGGVRAGRGLDTDSCEMQRSSDAATLKLTAGLLHDRRSGSAAGRMVL